MFWEVKNNFQFIELQGHHSQLTKSIKLLWIKYSFLIKIQRIIIFLIHWHFVICLVRLLQNNFSYCKCMHWKMPFSWKVYFFYSKGWVFHVLYTVKSKGIELEMWDWSWIKGQLFFFNSRPIPPFWLNLLRFDSVKHMRRSTFFIEKKKRFSMKKALFNMYKYNMKNCFIKAVPNR